MSKFKITRLPYDKAHEKKERALYSRSVIDPQTTYVGATLNKIDSYVSDWGTSTEGQIYQAEVRKLLSPARSREEHRSWLRIQIRKYLNWELYREFYRGLWKLYPFSDDKEEYKKDLRKRRRFIKRWAEKITLPLVYALMSVDEKLVKLYLK